MANVLVLGAGLVARPLVRYLLERPNFRVVVASRTVSKAEELLQGHARGTACALTVNGPDDLRPHIQGADLVVSLLPATHHRFAAQLCVDLGIPMVTTSYVSPAMRALDEPARQKGVLLLNEIGLDPGIDHMSAMKVIHGVQHQGGRVVSFGSYCGGLPAPEANNNPWGYKFSWSPRGVLVAGTNSARYLKDNQIVEVPGPELFDHYAIVEVPGAGKFEGYPNRDSLIYQELYGLLDARGMFRGTLRNLGHCKTWKKMADLGLLDQTERPELVGQTFADFMQRLVNGGHHEDMRQAVADKLGLPRDSEVIDKYEWLGLFSDDPLPTGVSKTALDIMASRMAEKMAFRTGERDMIVLQHEFEAEYARGKSEKITSTLIDFGEPNGDSAMARTVSLPAAIAVRMILEGRIKLTGVQVPVMPEIYTPVLQELEGLGIVCHETVTAL